jgi:hypothetical protein
MSVTAPDLFTAQELQAQGMALADEAEPSQWKADADQAIALLAGIGKPFSAEDVRRLAGSPIHCAAVGPRFQAAIRSGVIRVVGYTTGQRPVSRGRLMRLYQGVA